MKVGIVGAGAVGAASLLSLVMRGPPACEIIVIDKNQQRAKGVVADLQYGATLSPAVAIRAGDYTDLDESVLVVINAGVNERVGARPTAAIPLDGSNFSKPTPRCTARLYRGLSRWHPRRLSSS